MPVFTHELLVTTLALISAVVLVSALLSGVVERTGLPQVAVFLALGAILGPYGLGLMDVGLNSPILRVVATLSLALVLFTDAVSLNIAELRANKLLGFLVLGPGTLFSAALIAIAAYWVLKVPVPFAAMLGAALASTDPVLLRGVLRRSELDAPVRQALRMESGLNDAVLVPIVLIATAAATGASKFSGAELAHLLLQMIVLSPLAGVVVALAGIGSLELVRRRVGVRRDYESIYSLGIAFAAFAAAEAVHGSGFIAAFAAGLTVAALDVELCDCFLEYGETTAEMALLFAFVLFGVSMIWTGLKAVSPAIILFAFLCLLARPVAFVPALIPARIRTKDSALIAWFGPRGLSTLLLILLPVFVQIPGTERLLSVCCTVVLLSVVLHGFSPLVVFRKREPAPVAAVAPSAPRPAPKLNVISSTPPSVAEAQDPDAELEYIDVPEVQKLMASGEPPILVDARSNRSFEQSDELLEESIRLDPERPEFEATRLGIPKTAVLVIFCT